METNEQLVAENKELRAMLKDALSRIARLDSHLQVLLKKEYGKSSEKLIAEQHTLFGGTDAELETADATDRAARPRKSRKKKSEGRPAFPDNLRRKDIICVLGDEELTCPTCGATLVKIGVDACERGHFVSAEFLINRYLKTKYACPAGHMIKTAEAPAGIMARAKYEPSVYAEVVTSRFNDHLPYYRQVAIFKRIGVKIPRSSMGDMAKRVAAIAEIILKQMLKELIAEKVLQADETSITVLNNGQKGSKKGWMWVYRTAQKVLFDFTMTRGPDSPNRILRFFKGILQCDGYPSYNNIVTTNGLIRAGCWAHLRRKFYECFQVTGQAEDVLLLIQRLYWLEAALKKRCKSHELSEDEFIALRLKIRQSRSTVVLAKIKDLVLSYEANPKAMANSLLNGAVIYAMNQWPTMKPFLEHGELEIDNNGAERAIRPIAVGRKNWMVLGNEEGGKTAAILYSLVESCKAIDVNPREYLEDIIVRAQSVSDDQVHTLTPWAWKANQALQS